MCVFYFIKLDGTKQCIAISAPEIHSLKTEFGFLIQMTRPRWVGRSLPFVATETQTHRDSTMWDPAIHSTRKIEFLMSQASN